MSKSKTKSQAKATSGITYLARGRAGKVGLAPRLGSVRSQQIFDEMLRHPTIRLAVDIITAMLMRQPWTVEGEDSDYCMEIWKQLEPHRETIIRSSLWGLLRDGWRCFEVWYEDGQAIAGIKPLRGTMTTPLVFEDTGEFAGVENVSTTQVVEIDAEHVIFVNFDNEYLGDLGEPLLRTAYGSYARWENCDEGAQRYDVKVAGGFLKVEYPIGEVDGVDNLETARTLALDFQAAGYGLIPRKVDPDTGEVMSGPWNVEHIAAGGGLQPNFIVREKYLDAMMLRAFGIPERTTTEGTFGTKAEAEAHADVAVIVNTDRHHRIITAVQHDIVERINEANLDDKDAARLVLGKLDPQDRDLFSSIFTSLMTDPVFGEKIADIVDVPMLLDKLNIPTREDVDFDELMQEEETPPAPDEEIIPEEEGDIDEEVPIE